MATTPRSVPDSKAGGLVPGVVILSPKKLEKIGRPDQSHTRCLFGGAISVGVGEHVAEAEGFLVCR